MTKTFTHVRAAHLAAIAAAIMAMTSAAHAATDADAAAPTAEIAVGSVDFSSAKAVDHLIVRLHRVALDMCVDDTHLQAGVDAEQRACIDTAFHSGLVQIEARRQLALRARAVHVASAQHEAVPAH